MAGGVFKIGDYHEHFFAASYFGPEANRAECIVNRSSSLNVPPRNLLQGRLNRLQISCRLRKRKRPVAKHDHESAVTPVPNGVQKVCGGLRFLTDDPVAPAVGTDVEENTDYPRLSVRGQKRHDFPWRIIDLQSKVFSLQADNWSAVVVHC